MVALPCRFRGFETRQIETHHIALGRRSLGGTFDNLHDRIIEKGNVLIGGKKVSIAVRRTTGRDPRRNLDV